MKTLSVANLYFIVVLIFLMYLIWLMMKPFLGAIIFASIIAGSVYPIFDWCLKKTGFSIRVTALLMCCLIAIAVFFPLIYLSLLLSKEAISLYQTLISGINDAVVNEFLFGEGYFATLIKDTTALFGVEVNMQSLKMEVVSQLKNISMLVLNTINQVIGDIIKFIFNFVIMVMIIYALLAQGKYLKRFLLELSPLPDEQEELILEKFNQMNYVTLVCNGVGGLIQGVLAGVGFWVAGIKLIVLWTTIMILLAFIPLLGMSIIYIPACIYLAITGKTFASVTLFIYCTLVALITENWFKPLFIGKRINMDALLVLFAIIGGMTVFGFGGIFYGPIIMILFLTMVELYHSVYNTSKD